MSVTVHKVTPIAHERHMKRFFKTVPISWQIAVITILSVIALVAVQGINIYQTNVMNEADAQKTHMRNLARHH